MNISDEQARVIRDCVAEVVMRRQRFGQPIPQRVRDLLTAISVSGSESDCAPAQSDQYGDDLIDTTEAADILGCSTRNIRYIRADLDGHQVAGRWVFKRHKVTDYGKAKRCQTRTPSCAT